MRSDDDGCGVAGWLRSVGSDRRLYRLGGQGIEAVLGVVDACHGFVDLRGLAVNEAHLASGATERLQLALCRQQLLEHALLFTGDFGKAAGHTTTPRHSITPFSWPRQVARAATAA